MLNYHYWPENKFHREFITIRPSLRTVTNHLTCKIYIGVHLDIRSTVTLPTELRGRTEKVVVVGSIPTEVKINFSLPRVVP